MPQYISFGNVEFRMKFTISEGFIYFSWPSCDGELLELKEVIINHDEFQELKSRIGRNICLTKEH